MSAGRGRLSLVEAAGVEPASGKVYREEPTYLVRSKVSAGSLERTRKNRPSPINFSLRLRTEACGQSREMTPFPAMRARRRERADLIRRRRLTACCYWQLLWSDRLTGARNPVCLFTTVQSRRIRYAPPSSFMIPHSPSPVWRREPGLHQTVVPYAPSGRKPQVSSNPAPRIAWRGSPGLRPGLLSLPPYRGWGPKPRNIPAAKRSTSGSGAEAKGLLRAVRDTITS